MRQQPLRRDNRGWRRKGEGQKTKKCTVIQLELKLTDRDFRREQNKMKGRGGGGCAESRSQMEARISDKRLEESADLPPMGIGGDRLTVDRR